MQYIGATVVQIREAIRQGRVGIAQRWTPHDMYGPDGLLEVRGAGAKRLTRTLNSKLAKRWFEGGAGARIAVAWMHSDSIHREPDIDDIKVVAIVRPELTPQFLRGFAAAHDWSVFRRIRGPTPERVFAYQMARTMKSLDDRVTWPRTTTDGMYLSPGNRYGNDHTHIMVWPAGITDDRTSAATNKVHDAVERRNAIRIRNKKLAAYLLKSKRDQAARAIQASRRKTLKRRGTVASTIAAGAALKRTRLGNVVVPEIHAKILKKAFWKNLRT